MQICLDYYRILGLPIQTSADLIESAYSDRVRQLPQHEYSEAAIASRHDLLTEAYEVLSRPEKRIRYDGLLLKTIRSSQTSEEVEGDREGDAATPNVEIYTPPTLEITSDKFLGALLVLYELGEYKQILQLAQPYLDKPRLSFSLEANEFELTQTQWRDLVLVTALSHLEIGREDWQKGEYELAARVLESGMDLLSKDSLFNSAIEEMQAEIYKLRPYRILELVSLEENKVKERMQGLQMLKEMLDARGGINGSKNDRSGLRTEDFLRFIQQLRAYITTVEQQALFELEARRPSEVGSYLAVCALLGRGLDQKQPPLILKAKEMLLQLSQRRDVHLERAICALLLRQVEEAGRAIELSGDEEAAKVIREKSEKAPDLLPGLCIYTEQWFEKEIFPYFRDLKGKHAVLKEYFLDEEVQEYLSQTYLHRDPASSWEETAGEEGAIEASVTAIPPESYSGNNNHDRTSVNTYGTKIPKANVDRSPTGLAPERIVITPSETESRTAKHPRDRRRERRRIGRNTVQARRRSLKPVFWGLLGLGLLISGIAWAISRQSPKVTVTNAQPDLSPPPVASAIPTTEISPSASTEPTAPTPAATQVLDKEQAQEIVENWLKTKARARGKQREIAILSNILAQPALNDQKRRAEGDRQSNSYWEYEHSSIVKSVQLDPKNKKIASIDAKVLEKYRFFQAGKEIASKSATDDLLVRYSVVKQGDRWLISQIQVLN